VARTVNRQQVIAGLVAQHGWKFGVELGVYKGDTLFYLLEKFPTLCMIGIDRWERTPGPVQDRETGEASYAKKPMDQIAATVEKQSRSYWPRCLVVRGDTARTARAFEDSTFDFVFVDADHTTAAVLADIAAWRPKIKSGGALLGHDYNWPSVRRAVDAVVPGWQGLDAHVWFSPCHS